MSSYRLIVLSFLSFKNVWWGSVCRTLVIDGAWVSTALMEEVWFFAVKCLQFLGIITDHREREIQFSVHFMNVCCTSIKTWVSLLLGVAVLCITLACLTLFWVFHMWKKPFTLHTVNPSVETAPSWYVFRVVFFFNFHDIHTRICVWDRVRNNLCKAKSNVVQRLKATCPVLVLFTARGSFQVWLPSPEWCEQSKNGCLRCAGEIKPCAVGWKSTWPGGLEGTLAERFKKAHLIFYM